MMSMMIRNNLNATILMMLKWNLMRRFQWKLSVAYDYHYSCNTRKMKFFRQAFISGDSFLLRNYCLKSLRFNDIITLSGKNNQN